MFLKQIICIMLLFNRLSWCQPITSLEEEEYHLDNRLRHYIKRIELVAQKTQNQFSNELQNLIETFTHSLTQQSFKEKSLLMEQHDRNLEFADFLSEELDKQYINEDILIELWYLNEIVPYVSKDLYDEVIKLIHDLKETYRTEDLETKLNIYAEIGENISEKLFDYFHGEDDPVPVLNAELKYYSEYLEYLLKEFQLNDEFVRKLNELSTKVATAMASDNKSEKEDVTHLFDDIKTKFGRFLDEHFLDFNMFKFGE